MKFYSSNVPIKLYVFFILRYIQNHEKHVLFPSKKQKKQVFVTKNYKKNVSSSQSRHDYVTLTVAYQRVTYRLSLYSQMHCLWFRNVTVSHGRPSSLSPELEPANQAITTEDTRCDAIDRYENRTICDVNILRLNFKFRISFQSFCLPRMFEIYRL